MIKPPSADVKLLNISWLCLIFASNLTLSSWKVRQLDPRLNKKYTRNFSSQSSYLIKMKLCTTSVLEGWPSNNQSKAPKWAFRTAKNQFILLELPHSMGFDFYCSNFCEVQLERTTMPQPFKEVLSTYTWFYWNSVWKHKSETVHRRVQGKKENTLPLIIVNCNCSLRSKKILEKRISLLPLGLPLFHHEVKFIQSNTL